MGQLSSKECPLCAGPNEGKWTCPDCTPVVKTYRELLRNLQTWMALFERGEVDDIITPGDGREYCLWDVKRLYESRHRLQAPRQAQAIQVCLYENTAESAAAVQMGVSPKSPVAIYATVGLSRLLGLARRGEIPGLRLREDY